MIAFVNQLSFVHRLSENARFFKFTHNNKGNTVAKVKMDDIIMRNTNQNHIKQRNLFFEPSALLGKPTVPLFPLPEDRKPRRINHMVKFKPFHEFQKPLIGFTPETFLDYVETVIPKDHLCRVVKEKDQSYR